MSLNLPQTILNHWNAASGLPVIWLEEVPEPVQPPIALLESTGFSREYLSAGLKQDAFNHKISILTTSAESTWTASEQAMAHMEALAGEKIISVAITPDSMAKPFKMGQMDVWVFEFSVDIRVFDN